MYIFLVGFLCEICIVEHACVKCVMPLWEKSLEGYLSEAFKKKQMHFKDYNFVRMCWLITHFLRVD